MGRGSPVDRALNAARVPEIRRSAPDDDESFWRCLDAVCRERRCLAFVEAPPLDEARAYLAAGRARGMLQYVALEDGAWSGGVTCRPTR